MKKLIGFALVMSCCFTAAAQADSTKKRIVDSTCACLTAMPDIDKKTKEDIQLAIGQCMMQKSMTDFMMLAQERNIEMSDMDGMQKLGAEIGIDLVKSNCKAMNDLMLKMAESKVEYVEKDAPVETPSIKGVVQSVELNEFVYVTVLSGAKATKLVWSDYVNNGNDYVKDFTKLKNKTVQFYFFSKDVYSPKAKAYITVNMISGIK
jgi:hypothetical protein